MKIVLIVDGVSNDANAAHSRSLRATHRVRVHLDHRGRFRHAGSHRLSRFTRGFSRFRRLRRDGGGVVGAPSGELRAFPTLLSLGIDQLNAAFDRGLEPAELLDDRVDRIGHRAFDIADPSVRLSNQLLLRSSDGLGQAGSFLELSGSFL